MFLVMTALESPGAVDQLVRTLAPFPVLIHHDRRARAEHGFTPAGNLDFVPGPGRAGWGEWAYIEALRESLRHCLSRADADYVQVLSGSCLPIRPPAEFADFLAESPADIHADWFDVRRIRDATLNYAHRVLADRGTLAFRALRRIAWKRFGEEPVCRPFCGLELPLGRAAPWLQWVEPVLSAAMAWQARAGRPAVLPVMGSNWFGLRREACAHLVDRLSDPAIVGHFRHRYIPEEHAIPAILAASPFIRARSNHLISRFDRYGHPRRWDEDDLPRLRESQRWFARKFPDDPLALVRRRMVAALQAETVLRRGQYDPITMPAMLASNPAN